MEISNNGIDNLKILEGFSPKWYPDANGESIGYGHFRLTGDNFMTVTMAEANDLLLKDIKKFEKIINSVIKVAISQNQFDALVIFCYNTGVGKSALYDLINQKADIETILKWWVSHYTTSKGKTLPALIKRRAIEANMFANGATMDAAKSILPTVALIIILAGLFKHLKF